MGAGRSSTVRGSHASAAWPLDFPVAPAMNSLGCMLLSKRSILDCFCWPRDLFCLPMSASSAPRVHVPLRNRGSGEHANRSRLMWLPHSHPCGTTYRDAALRALRAMRLLACSRFSCASRRGRVVTTVLGLAPRRVLHITQDNHRRERRSAPHPPAWTHLRGERSVLRLN